MKLCKWRVRKGDGMFWRSRDGRTTHMAGEEFEATVEEARWKPMFARRIERVMPRMSPPEPVEPPPPPRRRGRPRKNRVAYSKPPQDRAM